ncbi:hypothetical protein CLOLEP_03692 [[Clostridium] leptum DSM 753]|uniref:Uncharacterized protein n=1 Tax=[Clostridium] leptum DSM 753 TaxID=428125 RepID=A7VYL4_9FIRM|nr:hypothetical protein CLOLEP_03692 [[Clostridium] leptum DSM 753]
MQHLEGAARYLLLCCEFEALPIILDFFHTYQGFPF